MLRVVSVLIRKLVVLWMVVLCVGLGVRVRVVLEFMV